MLTKKDLEKYREIIGGAVIELGRDDVGVGDVAEVREGVLSVTFSRGTRTSSAEIGVDRLQDHEEAKHTVGAAMIPLSKAIAQEAIQKA